MQPTRPKTALAALVQAMLLLAGGLSLGAAPAAAGSCSDWEQGWGDETESCVFSCVAQRQLTTTITSSRSYYVSASASCGGAGAACSLPAKECAGHGGVTTHADRNGQCHGEGKAHWGRYNTIEVSCDDIHPARVDGLPDARGVLHALLGQRDDWSCATFPEAQGTSDLMGLVPEGSTFIAMRTTFYSDASTGGHTAQGIRLTAKSCRNFTPSVELAQVVGEDAAKATMTLA